MEFNEESNESNPNEEYNPGTMKQWFQDNMRIIISILIVVLIAGGIYSYSKRTEAPITSPESPIENNAEGVQPGEQAPAQTGTPSINAPKGTSSVATRQETETSFIETAVKGDSQTKLARKALADYLEKNPDSSLTPEHKIYIEDFLRKNIQFKGKVLVGTSVEFSKGLISNAITKSKTLNERQLTNLHKYAVRVPSLS
jgi:hypothetical protein